MEQNSQALINEWTSYALEPAILQLTVDLGVRLGIISDDDTYTFCDVFFGSDREPVPSNFSAWKQSWFYFVPKTFLLEY